MKRKYLFELLIGLFFVSFNIFATCDPNIILTTPSSNFIINGDGTVTDKKTDLTWMRCTLGHTWSGNYCAGTANIYSWQQAMNSAEGTTFANYSDWRVPNVKELSSIVEMACGYPAINESIFPATIQSPPNYYDSSFIQPQYWTSTPSRSGDTGISVSFYFGYHGTRGQYIRLVRGG